MFKLTAAQFEVLKALQQSNTSFCLRSDFPAEVLAGLQRETGGAENFIDEMGPSIYLTFIGMMALEPGRCNIEG